MSRPLDAHPSSGWRLALYPAAGEAGGSFRYSWSRPRGPARGSDPERSKAEAARRARTKVRRYCAANRLNRLGTLTYAGTGCHDPRQLRRDVAGFFRALRRELGGEALPYVWVPEWHKTDHGLHAHFAVGRFVARRLIEQSWGRGFVHIKLLGDLPVGTGALGEARAAARYLSKYLGKDLDQSAGRLHRYEVAQGFMPEPVVCRGRSSVEAVSVAAERMGRLPDRWWDSSENEDWQGPPAVWVSWDG